MRPRDIAAEQILLCGAADERCRIADIGEDARLETRISGEWTSLSRVADVVRLSEVVPRVLLKLTAGNSVIAELEFADEARREGTRPIDHQISCIARQVDAKAGN